MESSHFPAPRATEGVETVVKIPLAFFIAVVGIFQTPAGLWPFLLVPIWLVWEIPVMVRQLQFTRAVERDWEQLVDR